MSATEPETGKASAGRVLAAARAELNLSLADVSQQIKYGVKQIAAIEADDYAKLPGATIVRGMIRSYAKLLQVDPGPLLANLDQSDIPAAIAVDLHTDEQEPFIEGDKKSSRIYVFLSAAALVAVGLVAYEWYANPPATGEVVKIRPKVAKNEAVQAPRSPAGAGERPGETQTQAVESQGQATVTPAVVVKRNVSGLKRMQLEFDQPSWVEIKQANGKILLSQLNPAGSTQSIEGVPPFELVIGNAAKVRLTYNDAPVDLRPYFKVDVARLTLE